MSTQPLQQVIAATRGVLAEVSADQLAQQTPCASWNVGELINHVIGAQNFFAAGLKGEAPSEDQPDWSAGDFLASYDAATAAALEAFSADGALEQMVKMPFGEMPGAAVMGLAMTDTFQHGWDLAKATNQSTDIAPELAAGILAQAKQSIPDAFRGDDGAAPFGAEQQCADGGCNADQLAAFLGRTV